MRGRIIFASETVVAIGFCAKQNKNAMNVCKCHVILPNEGATRLEFHSKKNFFGVTVYATE